EELKSFSKGNQLKNVNLKGLHADMVGLVCTYDVFIMASLYEGFSVALMEAMASGLPAVLPDLPVFREMGGDAALYFHPFEAESLTELLENLTPQKLVSLSEKSFTQASLLARKEAYLKKLLSIYAIN
ncbi:MAG TPA: glycosyltransferase, partial [Flavisolibacter sp.]|nr:glycosyltransferase [Flavisolibacter sp.]